MLRLIYLIWNNEYYNATSTDDVSLYIYGLLVKMISFLCDVIYVYTVFLIIIFVNLWKPSAQHLNS